MEYAQDWISDAVKALPEASAAWAGVCIILPLLTNQKRAKEANSDGFAYVTNRMRYYAELELLLQRFRPDSGNSTELMARVNEGILDLYQHILEFQIQKRPAVLPELDGKSWPRHDQAQKVAGDATKDQGPRR